MTTYLKFILGRMKERVRFTLASYYFTLNHVEMKLFFPPHACFYWDVKQISSSWSSFRLWTCTREVRSQSNPCTEDWSTHLWMWRTYKRYTEHSLVETVPSATARSHVSSVPLQNISEGKYKSFEEFRADAQLIVHNTAILHGGEAFCTTVISVIYETGCVHSTQVSTWPIPHSLSTVNSDQTEIARLLYNDTCHEVRLSNRLEF